MSLALGATWRGTVTATLSADGKSTYIINGTKRWVTGARIADYVYTLVRSGN